jgi:hypothetical protein
MNIFYIRTYINYISEEKNEHIVFIYLFVFPDISLDEECWASDYTDMRSYFWVPHYKIPKWLSRYLPESTKNE